MANGKKTTYLPSFKEEAVRRYLEGGRSYQQLADELGPVSYTHLRQVFPGRRIVAAFQPHRFSRTQAHFGEFCKVFDQVDDAALADTEWLKQAIVAVRNIRAEMNIAPGKPLELLLRG